MNENEKQENYLVAERLIAEQNFVAAVIAGAIATLIAALGYGITVAFVDFAYGFAAASIGIVVGLPMGFLGREIATKFAVVAALYTIVGCMLGSLFRAAIEMAPATATSPIDIFRGNSLGALLERAVSAGALIELVYWFVAVFAAVFLAKRPLSRAQRLAIGLYARRPTT